MDGDLGGCEVGDGGDGDEEEVGKLHDCGGGELGGS